MIPYIAYVSILFAATFIVYWLFLRKETFYKINRFFLIGAIFASLVIPLLTVPSYISFRPPVVEVTNTTQPGRIVELTEMRNERYTKNAEAPAIINNIESISEEALLVKPVEADKSWLATLSEVNYWKVLWYIYLIGVGIFAITFLIQFVIIMLQKRNLQYIQDGKFKIYELTEDASPFSFMRWIFINPELYDFETYNQILEHEKIHVAQAHYFDKMLAEIAVIFNWFNPFVWMYRKAITNNLEFLTDFEMIGKGTEPKTYQMSLLKVSVPQHGLNLTTNYNESFLSERIKMMNAKKSSARSSWKYLLIFPLLGLSMATLNAVKPITTELTSNISDVDAESENQITKVISKKPTTKKNSNKNLVVGQQIESDEKEEKNNTQITTTTTTNFEVENQMETIQKENRRTFEEQITDQILSTIAEATSSKTNSSTSSKKFSGFDNFTGDFQESIKNTSKEIAKAHANEYQKMGEAFIEKFEKQQIEKASTDRIEYQSEKEKHPVSNVTSHSINKVRPGKWDGKVKGEELCLNLNYKNNHNTSFCIEISEIKGFVDGENVTFQVVRDAGTLTLDGSFKRKNGSGSFEFEDDRSFKSFIENALSGAKVDDSDMFMFFIIDMDRNFVKTVVESGYDISVDNLVEFGIFNINGSKLNEFERIAKKIGKKRISPKRMIEMQIHGVDEEFVDDMLQNGDRDVTIQNLVAAKIHQVDPEVQKALDRYGFENFSFEKLIEMEIHGVTPQYIKEMSSVGLTHMSATKLVEFKIHGVNVRDIEAFRKMDLDDITPSNIVAAKIHGVTKKYVTSIRDSGAREIDLQELIAARIHGVTADFIAKAKRKGHANKALSKYVELRIHGLK